VSADAPDWSRERKPFFAWAPAKSLLASLRAYERARGSRVRRIVAVLRHRFWSVVTGADIPLGTQIGGGLLLPHPNGIVIHPKAVIGPNCLIFQQVTIGTVNARKGLPRIEGHVDIGAGARVLGPVHIGAHARVGSNAVVLKDVPAGASATGVPARVTLPSPERSAPKPATPRRPRLRAARHERVRR
jgi:serine O-acetyltransferase